MKGITLKGKTSHKWEELHMNRLMKAGIKGFPLIQLRKKADKISLGPRPDYRLSQ